VKIQPTSPGQPDIEHKTSRTVRAAAPEEFLNRGEQLDTQAYRSEQTLKPLAYLFIVVNDDDSRFNVARKGRCSLCFSPQSSWVRRDRSGNRALSKFSRRIYAMYSD
jgi:hypothetical protein